MSIRMAASCGQPRQVSAVPRGARTGRGPEAAPPAGVVSARLDWNKLSEHGGNVNRLTSERVTDMGGGPTFYSTLVEVRRAGIRKRDQGIVEV